MGGLKRAVAAWTLLCTALTPALAQQDIRIGYGYGLAFLPFYICEDFKLVEKHGKAAHLDLKASLHRLMGAEQVRDALTSGAIDIGPFGTAPLLDAWQRHDEWQMLAVSGITSMPLTLLGSRADLKSIADLKTGDRIAVPTLSSPQVYLLQMQSEKSFGQYDRLRRQTVVLSHADAIAGLVSGDIAAYFSSPPFTELALRDPKIHPLLTSSEVVGGKISFLVLGATRATIAAQPQLPAVIEQAIDAAARLIHDDPRRAAQIYLTHEPSGTINGAAMEAVVKDIKDEFGSAVYGMQTMAEFMGRHGELKAVPKSWKEIVAPAMLSSPSS